MRRIYLLLTVFILIFVLAACQGDAKDVTESDGSNVEKNVQIKGYFTTNEVDINDTIPILYIVKNDSDKAVKVTEDDFSLEKPGEEVWFGSSTGEEPRFISVDAHKEEAIIAHYLVTHDGSAKEAFAQDFNLHYNGDLENVQYPLTLSDEVPAKYKEMAAEWNEEPEDDTDKPEVDTDQGNADEVESEIVNGFEVVHRFKVTGYHMEYAGGNHVEVNIRVENLTDKEQLYDTAALKMYDLTQEYGLGSDSESVPESVITIPPHGKADYVGYYLFVNDHDASADEVIAGIQGLHYIDDQIMEVLDVYGDYQQELPEDFSPL
ncbi:hypothetical protein SFC66_04210 [Terribacillus saccharophilus]|uniref:hypothetical protein n=1 Tax=Terribacillus saccharophilus TaxID=361277 RepID=UPI0039825311